MASQLIHNTGHVLLKLRGDMLRFSSQPQFIQQWPNSENDGQIVMSTFLKSPVCVIAILLTIFGLVKLWRSLFTPSLVLVPGVPVVGKPTDTSFEAAIREGDTKYPDEPYQIPLPVMPTVFFPNKCIPELFNNPAASFQAHTDEILLGEYTYQGEDNPELKGGIRLMSRNLDITIDSFVADVEFAFQQCFGDCSDWVTLDHLWPTTFRMAAILSSRPFLGSSLSHNKEWVESVLAFAMTLSNAVGTLRGLPKLFRFLFEERLPRIRAMVEARNRCEDMMMPLIEEHIERWRANGGPSVAPKDAKTHPDGGELLDFIIPHYSEPKAKKLARDEITVILESMLNLSSGLSHVLYTMAKYGHIYGEDLRQEYLEAIGEDGKLTTNAMFKMRKMDSFMKETQRINPPSLMAMQRKIVPPRGHQFSVGPPIPQGTLVAVSADRVNTDPNIYPEPFSFDAYRFLRMREQPGEEFKHQHVSTSQIELNFSYGGRACPGRIFFAAMEKVVLSHILMHYEVRVKPGYEHEDSRWIDGIRCTTNPNAIMQIRRKVAKA
ncbi:uncharacterized protein Z518_00662 [Rhinocladiella mackenziei CBS 650.93]|uniref:Cytochrome P450 n=1 Tax=Rhinocladiella mackenziei CBS 650.93 TaxID=1442369 RepID=A0A0D2G4H3_9EURO|nr:uncharacterized protein Z518_00662 [Rhinocladiella mackenziei CBS 650.93]KIX09582.1 hypothetical protein Z518_00662 [Rhinocladiella mackenziei CBS 650.93]